MKQIFPSSEKVMQIKTRREAKYPWQELRAGQSFQVSYSEIALDSLRPLASRMGKKFGKRFRVVDHGEKVGYEVACLPMTETEAIQTSSNVVDALRKVEGKE